MKESTHLFGAHKHLLGTLTRPAAPARPDIGCVLMSAGVIHRIGPHRFNVKLARELAAHGTPSLRVDLAAVGDSRTPPTDTAYDQQATLDLSASIDQLIAETGVKHVMMVGLCSGAVYSLQTALQDQRVGGVYLIDGYAFPTARSRRGRYLQRARTLTASSLGRKVLNRLSGRQPEPELVNNAPDYGLSCPPIEEFVGYMRTLLARKVSIRQLYTGSILQYYNYDEQFAEAFADYPDVQAIPSEFAPAIDHTFTSLEAQQAVISRVLDWRIGLRPVPASHG